MYSYTKENINLNTLRFLYGRYKDFVVPLLIIFTSFLLFIKVIVPQIQDFFKVQEEEKAARQRLSIMENKFNFLKSISDSNLDSQLAVVGSALPIDKDFGGVLYALSDVSNKTGVSLGAFTFAVGSLSKPEGEEKSLTFDLNLILDGNTKTVADFIDKIQKTLPLSEVTKISTQEKSSTIAVRFYYRPLVDLKYNDSLTLSPVSSEGLSLISKLSAFSIPKPPSIPLPQVAVAPSPTLIPLPTSTFSAKTNPFF